MKQINALNLLCSANYCLNKLKPDTHACTMLEFTVAITFCQILCKYTYLISELISLQLKVN